MVGPDKQPDLIVPHVGPLVLLAQADALHLTEIGELFLKARQSDPDVRSRNAGELAILEWLGGYVEHGDHGGHGVLIVYENGRIPRFVRETGLDLNTDVLATRAFLELAERRGVITSAEGDWERIVQAAPTANPDINIMTRRRPGTGGGGGT